MMDGQGWRNPGALDAAGALDVSILAYSVKYASARSTGPSASRLLAHRQSQDVPAGSRQHPRSAREVALDVEQGADIVMVKPALGYLDVVRAIREAVDLPVAVVQRVRRVRNGRGGSGKRLDQQEWRSTKHSPRSAAGADLI